MALVLILAAAASSLPSLAGPSGSAAANAPRHGLAPPCRPDARWTGGRASVRVVPLTEAPPGKLVRGVYREVGGCSEPIVLRERVGTVPRR